MKISRLALPSTSIASAAFSLAAVITLATSSAAAHDEPGGGSVGGPTVSGGSEGSATGDKGTTESEKKEEKKEKSAFRGSMLLVDQSMTTSFIDRHAYLSHDQVSLAELWISPRVYYYPSDHIKLGARFDFFTEETNTQDTTTLKHETVYGDPWLTAGYSDAAKFLNGNEATRWAVGLTLRPPLSKTSRGQGQYFAFGPSANLAWAVDINGPKAKFLQGFSLSAGVSYSHAFTRYKTAVPFGSFQTNATDTNGNATVSDQVRSSTLAGNSIVASVSAALDIIENMELSASMILIDNFVYGVTPSSVESNPVGTVDSSTHLRTLTWFLVSLDYDVVKELGLSVGYYSLSSNIAEDSSRRNVFYGPDARVFFSLTAHLDTIYDDVLGKKPAPASTASRGALTF